MNEISLMDGKDSVVLTIDDSRINKKIKWRNFNLYKLISEFLSIY